MQEVGGSLDALGMGSSASQRVWDALLGTGLCGDVLQNGQVSLHLRLPPVMAESCFLPDPSGWSISSQIPEFRFLKNMLEQQLHKTGRRQ